MSFIRASCRWLHNRFVTLPTIREFIYLHWYINSRYVPLPLKKYGLDYSCCSGDQDARSGYLHPLRRYWKDSDIFEIEFNLLSKINKHRIDFKTGDKGNEVSVRERTHKIDEAFQVSIMDKK